MKFEPQTLQLGAHNLIHNSTSCVYHADLRVGKNDQLIMECAGRPWVQRLMHLHNIIMQHQTGNLSVSPEVQEYIERRLAFFGEHLSQSHQ